MTKQTSLREDLVEAFNKPQTEQDPAVHALEIEAANQFLKGLATRFLEVIQEKKDNREFEAALPPVYPPAMVFRNDALTRVSGAEVQEMEGYAQLNAICARREVDMCLGTPFSLNHLLPDDNAQPFNEVRLFIGPRYADSKDAVNKSPAQPAQEPVDQHARARSLQRPLIRIHGPRK